MGEVEAKKRGSKTTRINDSRKRMSSKRLNSKYMNLYNVILICLITLTANACSIVADGETGSDSLVADMGFTMAGGYWISVPASLGGEKCDMMLDTGASVSILGSEFEEMLGPQVETAEVHFGGEPSFLREYRTSGLIVGGVKFDRELKVILMDFPQKHLLSRSGISGLLGAPFFFDQVLYISYETNVLKIYDKSPSILKHMGNPIPFEWVDGHPLPHVRGVLPNGVEVLFSIDTGAAVGLVLERKLFDAMLVSGEFGNIKKLGKRSTQFVNSSERMTTLSRLQVGPWTQRNLNTGDSISKNLIGQKFLSRYLVVLDYINNNLYLKPRSVWITEELLREDFATDSQSRSVEFTNVNADGEAFALIKQEDGSWSRVVRDPEYVEERGYTIESLHDKIHEPNKVKVGIVHDPSGKPIRRITRTISYSFEIDRPIEE